LILFSSYVHSQGFVKLPEAKKEIPTVIFNNNILGNLKIIDSIEQKYIKEIAVYKNVIHTDGHLNHFNNLSEYGIIYIQIDKEMKSKKQSEWNIFFGFKEDNPIYIDGYLIRNSEYEIATESICEIAKVLPNLKNSLKTEVLNIWTLDKIERKESDVRCGGVISKN
jgi:hypothetical protein